MRKSVFSFLVVGSVVLHTSAALAQTSGQSYRKQVILDARFGNDRRVALLEQAYKLKENIGKVIIGQENAATVMQSQVVTYLETFGTRPKDPVALHLIGLPGIGKSDMLSQLEKIGIKIIRVDAQMVTKEHLFQLHSLCNAAQNEVAAGNPVILLIDELDKAPELVREGTEQMEFNNPLITAMNQFLNDGKVIFPGQVVPVNLSNVLVVTAMNLSPEEIQEFSREVLKTDKNFYDFTLDDFKTFHEWIQRNPASAKSKILSHRFRSNTVSRLAPNALVVKPLELADYEKIVRLNVDNTISSVAAGMNADKRILVQYSDAYIRFLLDHTTFPPSGARETVLKVPALTQQLIAFGAKFTLDGKPNESLARPRELFLDYDANQQKAMVRITPQIMIAGQLKTLPRITAKIGYNSDLKTFIAPTNLSVQPPVLGNGTESAARSLTKREIFDSRFPRSQIALKGIAKEIDKKLIGQNEFTRVIEKGLSAFRARNFTQLKHPEFLVIAGFPGIGKSDLIALAGEYGGIPIARMNMQGYSSDEQGSVESFVEDLIRRISTAKSQSSDGKYIVLIEELDKVFEKNPQNGALVNRPVMNIIKDLLATGNASYKNNHISIRGAYTFITMNFGIDRFGFKADPRLTSIDDVLRRWKALSSRPSDVKEVLDSLFLPETVSRIMARLWIMRPNNEADYRKIIDLQIGTVTEERLLDSSGEVNLSQIELKLTKAYKDYLFDETVIPSEGVRHTVIGSRDRIARDLENAIKAIPRSSPIARSPIVITLDFDRTGERIIASAKRQDTSAQSRGQRIMAQPVVLTFPRPRIEGKIPEKRLITGIHEFGHAMAGIRYGLRFELATVIPPENGVGGYVKFIPSGMTVKPMLAHIYTALASRAMERVLMSENPPAEFSSIKINTGSGSDIQQATQTLFNMIYELGMGGDVGVIDRMGIIGSNRYANFQDLPADTVSKLAIILRQMEDFLVRDFMAAHSPDWYRDRILTFAREGILNEKQFYDLIGYPYPGAEPAFLGEISKNNSTFADDIQSPSPDVVQAMQFKQGNTQTTPVENMEAATQVFMKLVQTHLKGTLPIKPADCAGLLEPSDSK